MAIGDSVIRVSIIGDVKRLRGAIADADRSMGGFLTGVAKGFIAFTVVDKAFDAVQSVLDSADRAGDALARISQHVDDTDAQKLKDIAGSFSDIGVSAPDFLELTAGFSEFAAASGKISGDEIADWAEGVGKFAGALGRLKDVDPATLGDDIANFISGTRGAAAAAKELGLPFDDSLTPAQRYSQLMERLPGLLDSVSGANAGLDDKQASLNAKWETFGTVVGPGVEDILSRTLDVMINIAEDIPQLIDDMSNFFAAIESAAKEAFSPVARLFDIMQQVSDNFGSGKAFQVSTGRASRSEKNTVRDQQDFDERNGNSRTVQNRVGGP